MHADVVRDLGTDAIAQLPMPLVVAGLLNPDSKKDRQLYAVGYDHRGAVQQSVRYLLSLGHRRIAWLDTPRLNRPSSREAAFRKEMAAAGARLQESWIEAGASDEDPQVGMAFVHRLLSERVPPTAVLCATDLLAAGVMEGAQNWGKRVPEDLSVVGYGDGPWAAVVKPGLTSLHQRGFDLGVALANRLMACFDGTETADRWTVLPIPLKVRGSTGVVQKTR
jgi:DNA-binding LacI/PurR family transcriptional regulator